MTSGRLCQVSEDTARGLLQQYFNKEASSVKKLDSYDDNNFRITATDGVTYTLKVPLRQRQRQLSTALAFCAFRTHMTKGRHIIRRTSTLEHVTAVALTLLCPRLGSCCTIGVFIDHRNATIAHRALYGKRRPGPGASQGMGLHLWRLPPCSRHAFLRFHCCVK